MTEFSFSFTEGSSLLLNGQKHLGSVVEDLLSNKQKKPNEFIENGEGADIIKLLNQYFSTGHDAALQNFCTVECGTFNSSRSLQLSARLSNYRCTFTYFHGVSNLIASIGQFTLSVHYAIKRG